MDKRILDVETRRELFQLIQSNLGLHMREIARRTDMQLSLVEYHLRSLEENELVYAIKEGGYNRYYVDDDLPEAGGGGRLDSSQKRKLHLLRQNIPLRVVCVLLDNPKAKHKELHECVEVSASTLSYHLTRMVKAEILIKVRRGKDKGYRLMDRKEVLYILMVGHVAPPDVVDGFISTWEEFF